MVVTKSITDIEKSIKHITGMMKTECECNIPVLKLILDTRKLIESTDHLRSMDTQRSDEIKMRGFTYTRQELIKKIDRQKVKITEDQNRYFNCCKTASSDIIKGKLTW